MALYDDDLYDITALKQRQGIVGFTTMGLVLVTKTAIDFCNNSS